jgi:hypothetical protein
MADLGFGESGFDATAPENQRTNSVVPAGEYPMILVESERKQTKDGDGAYLKCKFQIVAGEFQNRIVFKNFNLWLPPSKEQALAIARGEFSEFCRAVNVPNPKDSSELHTKRFVGKVKVRVDKSGQYEDQNDISGFKPDGGKTAAQPQAAAGAVSGNPW